MVHAGRCAGGRRCPMQPLGGRMLFADDPKLPWPGMFRVALVADRLLAREDQERVAGQRVERPSRGPDRPRATRRTGNNRTGAPGLALGRAVRLAHPAGQQQDQDAGNRQDTGLPTARAACQFFVACRFRTCRAAMMRLPAGRTRAASTIDSPRILGIAAAQESGAVSAKNGPACRRPRSQCSRRARESSSRRCSSPLAGPCVFGPGFGVVAALIERVAGETQRIVHPDMNFAIDVMGRIENSHVRRAIRAVVPVPM